MWFRRAETCPKCRRVVYRSARSAARAAASMLWRVVQELAILGPLALTWTLIGYASVFVVLVLGPEMDYYELVIALVHLSGAAFYATEAWVIYFGFRRDRAGEALARLRAW